MEYVSMMHVAFYTDKFDEMVDFYVNKIGAKMKTKVCFGIYKDRADRPELQKIAMEEPDRVFNVYLELAPGQFLEIFPAYEGQKEHTGFNEHKGYSHFALLVEDIFAARKKLEERGLVFDTEISKGPSETYQMWTHDPDGNKFEIMQFTPNSIQVVGNL